jgi:phage-related minor tail protein
MGNAYRAGEVEVLLTVNDQDVDRAEKNVKATGQRIEKKPITAKVNADEADAIAGMDRVEAAAKRLVSQDVIARVDANIERGEKNLARIQGNLDYLRSVSTDLDVSADISRAEASLRKVERNLDGLRSARATMEVDADTSLADAALDAVADTAEDAGGDGGRRGGAALVGGIVGALASIPIAGAIAGIAHTVADTVAKEFQSALQIEVRQDRLEALTGIDEASAGRFARVAAEAYANTFGESIESNMNTTRLALQFDLIDEDATTRDAQKVVQGLAGISDVLDEDVTRSATAVSVLLSSGMAVSAQRAYDIIATGAREGLNRNEDLLDTLTEYPVVLRRLGLTGEEMLGLINQGLEKGARNTDVVADALKEFQIRATDASTLSAAGFERLGFSAEEMTAKIAAGGAGAREGLQQVLDKLRETEDPVVRNAAAVELFGTKAEDMGEALFALDLTHAVDQLNGVVGAADRMFDTLSDNDATRIQRAQRNIEVAAEGIKGALASAFAEPIGDAADWVSENRGPLLQFFLDLANGALDFGDSLIEAGASGVEGLGEITASLADIVYGAAQASAAIDAITPGDQSDATAGLTDLANKMLDFSKGTGDAADTMRDQLGSAIDVARDKLNAFGEPVVAMGYLNDASLRLASAIDGVGYSADGSRIALDGFDATNARASESGRLLEDQVRNAISALSDEIDAAALAGESQETLGQRYQTATGALRDQLEAMGLTEDQARALIDTVLQTPPEATTTYGSNAVEEQGKIQGLATRIETLPDGTVVVHAATSDAEEEIKTAARDREATIYVSTRMRDGGGRFASGGPIVGPGGPRDDLVPILASNGEHMITAAEVRAAGGHGEIYRLRRLLAAGALPRLADGGPVRSISIPSSIWRTDPPVQVVRTADGGAPVAARSTSPGPTLQLINSGTYYSYDPTAIAREEREQFMRLLDALPSTPTL